MNPFGDPPKPIKGFVLLRHQSVAAQLAGTSPGMELGMPGGLGGRGRRGGPGVQKAVVVREVRVEVQIVALVVALVVLVRVCSSLSP